MGAVVNVQAKAQPKPQYLENAEDFRLLISGDVVPTGYVGPLLNGPMLVSNDTKRIKGGIILIQRYTPDSVYRVRLAPNDVRVEGGQLKFDFRKGEKISIWGDRDWVDYEVHRNELVDAGLEQD
jgi:hypothetical protein